MTRILVDMDDVIFDWGTRYNAGLDAIASLDTPDGPITNLVATIPRSHEHRAFDLFAGMTDTQKRIIRQVLAEPGFYADLKPKPGALAALYEMEQGGHDVRIVTSPMSSNPTCADDKLASITRYLGERWRKRVVITDDKTIVHGDVLFDDRGDISGSMLPRWQQILVDMPHNRGASKLLPRVHSLTQWETALIELGFL